MVIKDRRGHRGRKPQGPRTNHQIKVPECRLIRENGDLVGVVSIEEAMRHRDETGLDLVEVSPNAKPPVVKLIDYGKYKYDLQKKANEAKKKQTTAQLKEIQFRPNIEAHDLETKLKRGKKFLWQGDKVKMVMQFRGREMAYKEAGIEKFKSIIEDVVRLGATVESEAKAMGNRVIAIVAPDKKEIKRLKSLEPREEKPKAEELETENP
ncbi:MAG: translation initiation factor IF-3 [Bacteriovoracaceae bacterium]